VTSLLQRLVDFGDRPALVGHDRSITYREMADDVAAWRSRLTEARIGAGAVCAVVGDPSIETIAALLALFQQRAIAVPICSQPRSRHEQYFDMAGAGAVIAESGAIYRREARLSPPLLEQLRAAGSAGVVLFSSGSTGDPKAALWSADRLLQRHRSAHRHFRTLIFLRLDHIGGLNTLFRTLWTGGCLIMSDRRDPESVCDAITQRRVELLPATPTFLKMMLMSSCIERFDLSSLQLITYGTEPMASGVLRDLCAALPGIEFKQTYGLSELGILPTQSPRRDSLWLRVGGPADQTRVMDGVLWVRAASAMLGYLNYPSPFDSDGWFNTEDAVEVEGDFIRILGRKSEIINVGGEKVYPVEVEAVLTQADNVRAAAVFGRPNAITGQIVAARVSLDVEEPSAEQRLIWFCRTRLAPHQVPMLIETTREPLHSERGKLIRGAGSRCRTDE
jgi:long-chain acyl-CoA synthetase